MDLLNKIQSDLKQAQLSSETLKVSVLRLLIAAVNNKQIEKRTKLSKSEPVEKLEQLSKLDEEEVIGVINSEAKKRREAIEGFKKGNREKQAQIEEKELAILQSYLPEQLSESEIKEIVKKAIQAVNAKTLADLGKVMGQTLSQVKGRAGGDVVARIAKEQLSS